MLLQVTEKYEVETEEEAVDMINAAKAESENKGYVLKKSSYTKKEKKSKGEVIGEWYIVELCKVYNSEYVPGLEEA